ncbi:MAG: alpha/beta hydrolase [Betaproteobacteria bacterium]
MKASRLLMVFTVAAVAAGVPSARAAAARVGRLDVLHVRSRVLDATRTVRVWLPPHEPRGTRYDVLYLNDGQNLFGDGNPDTGGGGWHADVAAAALVAAHRIPPLLIVGIDNAGDRSRGVDYLPVPDPFDEHPRPPGADRYLRFVVDELIPRINRAYPTRPGPQHTGFGGSSYGAVSAFYAAMARPGVFGRLLLESPSVGIGGGVLLERARGLRRWPDRIVMGVGTGEGRGGRGPNDAFETLVSILRKAGLGDERLRVTVQEGAHHNEAAWASRLPGDLAFLFRPADAPRAR